MKKISQFAMILTGCFLTAACSVSTESSTAPILDDSSVTTTLSSVSLSGTSSSSVTSQPTSSAVVYTESDENLLMEFSTSGLTVKNDVNSCVTVDGNLATIACAGNYYLSGSSDDFQVLVDADTAAKVYLYLNGLSLTSASDAPIYARSADKIFLMLVDGTTNSLTDAKTRTKFWSYTDENGEAKVDTTGAVIYGKKDITFKGNGTLTVTGNYNNGIHTTKDLKIKDVPTLIVTAENNGIKGKNSVEIEGGYLTITAGGDAIKSDEDDREDLAEGKGYVQITGGEFNIQSGDDGIHAANYVLIDDSVSTPQIAIRASGDGIKVSDETGTVASTAYMNAGVITIAAGSQSDGIDVDSVLNLNGATIAVTSSYEGFEASIIRANAGVTSVYASDDGWNATKGSPAIHVNGGYHYVKTGSGDTDGIDSNGDIYMEGGVLVIEAGGNTIDVGDRGSMYYTGGILMGFGSRNEGLPSGGVSVCAGSSSGMSGPGRSSQMTSTGSFSAGTRISALDESTVLSTFTLTQSASQFVYIWSASATIYSGGTYTAGTEISFGYGEGGSLADGTVISTNACSTSMM
ncbi:MAG: carbohydrate-binding domain-containing protein [Fibrobacter sp.]|nr:carbohydrate-binding domain-containing protein [Fibrobacter sp.]